MCVNLNVPKILVTFGMQHKSEPNFQFYTSLQGQQTEEFCLLDIFMPQHDIMKCGSLWGCVYLCVGVCACVHLPILLPFSHNVCLLAMILKICWEIFVCHKICKCASKMNTSKIQVQEQVQVTVKVKVHLSVCRPSFWDIQYRNSTHAF